MAEHWYLLTWRMRPNVLPPPRALSLRGAKRRHPYGRENGVDMGMLLWMNESSDGNGGDGRGSREKCQGGRGW